MRRSTAAVGLVIVFGLLLAAFASARLTRGAGQPHYPDLRTLPPANLLLRGETMSDGRTHYLLRFDNTVGNWGGRLEIVADLAQSRDLFQNVYDAYSGGNLISSTKVDSDLIFHPSHNHFHLQDFATYALLKKDSSGNYLPTTRRGTKTSFCILDTVRVAQIGTGSSAYNTCSATRQGLAPGWADVYSWNLPEQWIDMGFTVPEDGDYAIESIADPNDKLDEAKEDNNSARTLFSIRGGRLTATVTTPVCSLSPSNGPVGTSASLQCERLTAGETIDLRWNSQSGPILKTIIVNDQGNASTSLVIPDSTLGPHYVHAIGQSSGRDTLALFTTSPAVTLNKSSGAVGSSVGVIVTGFAAQEKVTVRYTTTGSTTVVLATLTVNAQGSASGTGTIPTSALGAHKVEARGGTSKKSVLSSFSVTPSLSLNLTTVTVGKKVGPTLRGFQKSERVTISIPSLNLTLKTIRVSSSGSANGTSGNSFTIPKNLAPGDYVIQARGTTSGISVTANLKVVAAATTRSVGATSNDEPTATPTSEATAKPEPTATEVPSEPTTTEPTAEPTEVEPTATATTESAPSDDDRRRRCRGHEDCGTPEG